MPPRTRKPPKRKKRRRGEALPPLTAEQSALARKWLRLVPFVLKRHPFFARHLGYDEALCVGREALCVAAAMYDPSRGWKFSGYAVAVIWSRLKKATDANGLIAAKGDKGQTPKPCQPLDRPVDAASDNLAPASSLLLAPEERRGVEPDVRDWIAEALALLPPRWSHVARRCVMEGASYAEAAAELGISRQAVQLIKVKALARLRILLGRLADEGAC